MKKNIRLVFSVLLSVLALSACNSTYEESKGLTCAENGIEEICFPEVGLEEKTLKYSKGSLGDNGGTNNSMPPFDTDKFSGKIEDIFYAGDNRILVYADSLCLYDMEEQNIVGEFSINEGRVVEREFFSTTDGYAMVGVIYGDSSDSLSSSGRTIKCWLFDKNFKCWKTIDMVDLILKEEDFMVFAAAVSQDSKKLGIVGNNALYLYNIETDTLRQVFDYNKTDYADIVMVNSVGFIEHDEKLVFTGMATNLENSENIPIYGLISVEGKQPVCHKVTEYELTDEMIIQDDEIWFPEAFDKATGKMLVTNTNGEIMRIVNFEGEDTGADGIFGSDCGEHMATIEWVSEQGCWRVRIYEAFNGELRHEQMIKLDKQGYAAIICKVRILDERNECIVVAGKNQETQIFSFFF